MRKLPKPKNEEEASNLEFITGILCFLPSGNGVREGVMDLIEKEGINAAYEEFCKFIADDSIARG